MASVTWSLANVDFDVDDGFCHTAHWTVTRVDEILSGLTLKISEEKTPTQGSFVPAS